MNFEPVDDRWLSIGDPLFSVVVELCTLTSTKHPDDKIGRKISARRVIKQLQANHHFRVSVGEESYEYSCLTKDAKGKVWGPSEQTK